ncbi:MAG: hypothetical protein K8J31_11680 [Anaerolineae bacterium]|nr:hypothetical protein [Anaerolineae bacterium]
MEWLLIGIGFALAGGAGLLLAAQVAQGVLDARGTVLGAVLAFIPAAGLVGAGIYRLTHRPPQAEPGQSTVEMQRQLMDHLNARGQLSTGEMCDQLGISEADLRALVDELLRLEIFPGYVDWDREVLYSAAEAKSFPLSDGSSISHNP